VLIVNASAGHALAGFVFNVLLIVRAPLQLFQAIQTSILPHLAGLQARESAAEFARAVRVTVLVIAGFAGACALGLLTIGPWVMSTVLGDKGFTYERGGLALMAVGMGFHLIAGTLNQAALARRRAGLASVAWLLCAGLFVAWVATPIVADEVLRVEIGYFGAAFLLSGLLWGLYRRG
jgi:O-antigen/teichoic acid export membrane protein